MASLTSPCSALSKLLHIVASMYFKLHSVRMYSEWSTKTIPLKVCNGLPGRYPLGGHIQHHDFNTAKSLAISHHLGYNISQN